jgi:hypothetical protein
MSKKEEAVVVIPLSKNSPHFSLVCPLVEALVGTIEAMNLLPQDIIDIITSLICYSVAKLNSCKGDHPEVSREEFAEAVINRCKVLDTSFKDPQVQAEIKEACLRHESKAKAKPEPEPEPEMPFYAWGPEMRVNT